MRGTTDRTICDGEPRKRISTTPASSRIADQEQETTARRAKDKRDALLYNLLPGDRERIAVFQGGKDPITGQLLKPNANCDHCHLTGLVRGLLNPMTNKRLVDNITVLKRTLEYLENPPAVGALGERVYGLMGVAKHKRKMRYGPSGGPKPQSRSVAVSEL